VITAFIAVVGAGCSGAAATPTATASVTQPPATAIAGSPLPSVASSATAGTASLIKYLNTTTTCQGAVPDAFFSEQECEKQLTERTAVPSGQSTSPGFK